MSLKIHLRIDETEIYRCRGIKFEGKIFYFFLKLKNELMIVFHDFCSFELLNVRNILGRTGRTDNVPDVSVRYWNQLPNRIISPEIQAIRG